jgi:hypothetical protein
LVSGVIGPALQGIDVEIVASIISVRSSCTEGLTDRHHYPSMYAGPDGLDDV